jgi:hypothetical protein
MEAEDGDRKKVKTCVSNVIDAYGCLAFEAQELGKPYEIVIAYCKRAYGWAKRVVAFEKPIHYNLEFYAFKTAEALMNAAEQMLPLLATTAFANAAEWAMKAKKLAFDPDGSRGATMMMIPQRSEELANKAVECTENAARRVEAGDGARDQAEAERAKNAVRQE